MYFVPIGLCELRDPQSEAVITIRSTGSEHFAGGFDQRGRPDLARFSDVDRVAELAAAGLLDRQCCLRALRDQPPFLGSVLI